MMDPQHTPQVGPEPAKPAEPTEASSSAPASASGKKAAAATPKKAAQTNTTEIGPTIVIRGKLSSKEDLVVRGRIDADITSTNALHVEKSGVIKATVRAKSARIDGIVVGNITADDKLEIAAEGRVVGDLYAPAIVIREGAAFRGNIDMPNFKAPGAARGKPPEVPTLHVGDTTAVDIVIDEDDVVSESALSALDGKRKKRR